MTRRVSVIHGVFYLGLMAAVIAATSPQADAFHRGPGAPEERVVFVAHSGPGGGFDIEARAIARIMPKYLGERVIVMNVPGAGGRIGSNRMFLANPDGHTIGVLNLIGFVPFQFLGELPFDLKDFSWVGRYLASTTVFTVGAKSRFQSLEDLKNAKKPIWMGMTGRTAGGAMMSFLAADKMGFPFQFLSGYAGSAASVTAIQRGELESPGTLAVTSVMPWINDNLLRPIFVYGKERSPLLPNVPSTTELGYPELSVLQTHRVIVAPPRTPPEILSVLEKALLQTLKDPEFLAWAEKTGRTPDLVPLGSKDTKALVDELMGYVEKQMPILRPHLKD
jgi:tripartite-type tricarboxylate transporter receptor subunit TctC